LRDVAFADGNVKRASGPAGRILAKDTKLPSKRRPIARYGPYTR